MRPFAPLLMLVAAFAAPQQAPAPAERGVAKPVAAAALEAAAKTASGMPRLRSLIVSHNGKIFERDLGKNSTEIGANMTAFDPGAGWKEVAAP